MAFDGTAVIKQISDRMVRITGLSLGEGGSGTIGLHGASGSPPDVTLPEAFKTIHYDFAGANVPFQDCITLAINIVGGGIGGGVIPTVIKTGTTTGDFRMTVHDIGGAGPDLEMLVTFH